MGESNGDLDRALGDSVSDLELGPGLGLSGGPDTELGLALGDSISDLELRLGVFEFLVEIGRGETLSCFGRALGDSLSDLELGLGEGEFLVAFCTGETLAGLVRALGDSLSDLELGLGDCLSDLISGIGLGESLEELGLGLGELLLNGLLDSLDKPSLTSLAELGWSLKGLGAVTWSLDLLLSAEARRFSLFSTDSQADQEHLTLPLYQNILFLDDILQNAP